MRIILLESVHDSWIPIGTIGELDYGEHGFKILKNIENAPIDNPYEQVYIGDTEYKEIGEC